MRALHGEEALLAERAQLLDLLLVARAQTVAVRVRRYCALGERDSDRSVEEKENKIGQGLELRIGR